MQQISNAIFLISSYPKFTPRHIIPIINMSVIRLRLSKFTPRHIIPIINMSVIRLRLFMVCHNLP